MNETQSVDRLLTTREVAERLQTNEERIHTMVKAGMPAIKGLGKGFRFMWPDVLDYVSQNFRTESDWRRTA